jgi:hypothetical protein
MTDPFDSATTPNCPVDLVPLMDEGNDPDGADARWVCPRCGLVQLAS